MIAFADDGVDTSNAHNPGKHASPLGNRSRDTRIGECSRNIRMICIVLSHTGTAKFIIDLNTTGSNCVWALRKAGRGLDLCLTVD